MRAVNGFYVAAMARRGIICTRGRLPQVQQVAIALADPVFDPQWQISRKFFCAERLISAIGME